MTKLEALWEAAEKATPVQWSSGTTGEWLIAADPTTILALRELVEAQHEALAKAVFHLLPTGTTTGVVRNILRDALALYDNFGDDDG